MSLEQTVEELKNELTRSVAALRGMEAAMNQQQAQIQSQNQELTRLQTQLASQQPVPSSPQAAGPSSPMSPLTGTLMPLVDTRTLGKPDTFSGDATKYKDWSIITSAYLGAVDYRFPELLEKIESSSDSTTFYNLSLTSTEKALSTQLYYILAMICRDRALDLIVNSGNGEGFMAWRSLFREFCPKLQSRYVSILMQILSFDFGSTAGDIGSGIASFEKLVREYENQTGKAIEDDMKLGVITKNMRDVSLREHLIRHAGRLNTWSLLREELMDIVRTQKFLQESPQPMDIGALPKGKGKKGKGKGKSKDSGKGKGETKNNVDNKDKECFYCKKKGHVKAECRKRLADLKKAEGSNRPAGGTAAQPGSGGAASSNAGQPKAKGKAAPAGGVVATDDFVCALPCTSCTSDEFHVVGNVTANEHLMLVDTGCGAHVFPRNFDEHSVEGASSKVSLATVTGEKLYTGHVRKSCFQLKRSMSFMKLDYTEVDNVEFPILSMGVASSKGLWMVVGPQCHFLIHGSEGAILQEAVAVCANKIPLKKERGVFWLELGASASLENENREQAILAGVPRGVRKSVPAELFDDDSEQEPSELHDPGRASDQAQTVESANESQRGEPRLLDESQRGEPRLLDAVEEDPQEEGGVRKAKSKRVPPNVSQQEMDEHELTHIPFRTWCPSCVAGKATEDYHRKRAEKKFDGEVPRVDLDYCFLKAVLSNVPESLDELQPKSDADRAQPVLVIVDVQTGCVFATPVSTKGPDPYSLAFAQEALKFLGHGKIVLQSDGEPAIKALCDQIAEAWTPGAARRVVPRHSHQSNGSVERAILQVARQVRCLRHHFLTVYPTLSMTYEHKLFGWLVKHASWLLTRFTVKQDGKTPYERLRGRSYKGEVASFAEGVHWKPPVLNGKLDPRTSPGLWLGKTLSSDDHIIGTHQGIRKCRTIFRRPDRKRHDVKWVDQSIGTPWQPRGQGVLIPQAVSDSLRIEPQLAPPVASGKKSVYITTDRQYKYGQTPGCKGCSQEYGVYTKPHSEECKRRFTELIEKENQATNPASSHSQDMSIDNAPSAPPGLRDHGEELSSDRGVKRQASQPAEDPRLVESVREAPLLSHADETAEVVKVDSSAAGVVSFVGYVAVEDKLIELITLHLQELCPLGATPMDDLHGVVYDERTGLALDPEKVRQGRKRELNLMDDFEVKQDISRDEARRLNLKLVRSRWVETLKPTEDDPSLVRSRLVAQELNTYKVEGISQGTPPLWMHRSLVSYAASSTNGVYDKLIARYDVSVAFFHADSSGGIGVIPPKGMYVNDDVIWLLKKAMNGTREASYCWGNKIRRVKKDWGFDELLVVPNVYFHKEWEVVLTVHGDDFLAVGRASDLDRVDRMMQESYKVKILPRIGPQAFGGEVDHGDHLHRTISWHASGFSWKADAKYREGLLQELSMKSSNGIDTPSSKLTGTGDRHSQDPLDEEETLLFRRLAGTLLYLSQDRPSIQFAASQVMEGMSKPLRIHMLRLKRLVRYIAKYPEEIYMYEYQPMPDRLEVMCDSDWAACRETRRSMSSLAVRFGSHLLETSCSKQSLVALSSGESEFYSLVRGGAQGIQIQQCLEFMKVKVQLVLLSDSSAARGIASRQGSGKVKHLAMKELWLQQAVRDKVLTIEPVDTLLNWSDLGTKSLDKGRLDSLMRQMPIQRTVLVGALVAALVTPVKAQPDEGTFEAIFKMVWILSVLLLVFLGRWSVSGIVKPQVVTQDCLTDDDNTMSNQSERSGLCETAQPMSLRVAPRLDENITDISDVRELLKEGLNAIFKDVLVSMCRELQMQVSECEKD